MIQPDVLSALLLDTFAFSPVAMSISTVGYDTSRYIKVNDAYLRLVGRSWDELRGLNMAEAGAAINNPARARRLRLLEQDGGYQLEEATIRRADGEIIPVLISARRAVHGGEQYDIEIIIDMSERERMQRALEFYLRAAAFTDPLTALPNRAAFDRDLEACLGASATSGEVVALAFIDLNGFKPVNDRHGHAMGDALLRAVAERLQASLWPDADAARLGGDEFALVVRMSATQAAGLPQRIQTLLDRVFAPFVIGGESLAIGAACGLTRQLTPEERASTLLNRADKQMYRAKASHERVALRFSPKEFPAPVGA